MAGIEADAGAVRAVHAIEHLADLLEARAEICALTRRQLQDHLDAIAGRARDRPAERGCDTPHARRAPAADVRARMEHHAAHAERLAPLDLAEECPPRFPPQLAARREVDEVRIVR